MSAIEQTADNQLVQRLLARTVEDGDCLIWTARLSHSAGHPKWKNFSVRRLLWEAQRGPLKASQLVTVTCGNPKCLAHLAITNKAEIARKTNADPRVKAIKRIKSSAIARKTAKLSIEKAREIRNSELTGKALAVVYGVSEDLISKVRHHKAWPEPINPFAGLGARA